MKYSVLIKPKVMIRISGIEAENQKEAAVKALIQYEGCMYDLLQRSLKNYNPKDPGGVFEYIEPADGECDMEALVDEEGDEEYENSEWYIVTGDDPEDVVIDSPELRSEQHAAIEKHKKLQDGSNED